MIDIVRVDHLAMVADDLERQRELLTDLFGFRPAGEPFEGETAEGDSFVAQRFDVPGQTELGFEVLVPTSEDTSLHRGFHHVALQVTDLDAAGTSSDFAPGDQLCPTGAGGHVMHLDGPSGGRGVHWTLAAEPFWEHPPAFTDDEPDTLGVRAIHNIGHATLDREGLKSWYRELLGFREPEVEPPPVAARAAVPTGQLGLGHLPLEFWLVDASRPESSSERILAEGRPALTHAYLGVTDWQRAVAALERRGIALTDDHQGEMPAPFGRWRAGGISPRDTGGISVRFSQMGYDGD